MTVVGAFSHFLETLAARVNTPHRWTCPPCQNGVHANCFGPCSVCQTPCRCRCHKP